MEPPNQARELNYLIAYELQFPNQYLVCQPTALITAAHLRGILEISPSITSFRTVPKSTSNVSAMFSTRMGWAREACLLRTLLRRQICGIWGHYTLQIHADPNLSRSI